MASIVRLAQALKCTAPDEHLQQGTGAGELGESRGLALTSVRFVKSANSAKYTDIAPAT